MKKENTATRLKQIMSNENLRQVDILAKTMPYCKKYGVKMNKSDLSQYCSGKTEPNQDKLFVLSLALNVSEAWLMGFDVPMERDSYNKQWDKEATQFSDSINSFHMELSSLGWSCKWIDSDKKYLLSNGNISFKISSSEYSGFVEDVNSFYKTRLEKLYEKSKVSLFPSNESATMAKYQHPITLAAHARTDVEQTSEGVQHDLDIMNDDSEWE